MKLTDRAVEHHDCKVWLDSLCDLLHLLKQSSFLAAVISSAHVPAKKRWYAPMPAGRVDYDDFESLLLELDDARS